MTSDSMVNIYANRGVIKLRQGQRDDAQKDFNKAAELDSSLKEKLDAMMTSATPAKK